MDILLSALRARVPVKRPEHDVNATFAFYEAYFSNYIEGTEFELDEAKAIVFEGQIPSARRADPHDVLGTFQLLNDRQSQRAVPSNVEGLLDLLRSSHRRILSARPKMRPGEFKEKANRAGQLVFVAPQLVEGTLAAGFERHRALEPGFARAVSQAFLVSEVHPFDDGNGRLARATMNAELTSVGEQRLMITTADRDSYLGALRALSFNRNPEALVHVLDRIQHFSQDGTWDEDQSALATLAQANAFDDQRASASFIDAFDGSKREDIQR